jgi:uncharacterized protein
MELNLEEAFDGPVDLSHRFEIPAERLDRPELLEIRPVLFSGVLTKAHPGFVLEGEIQIQGAASCSRCLAPVPFQRSGPVQWSFAPAHRRAETDEDEAELSEGDLAVVWYDDLKVPFDPLIDEEVQLEIPMKPLCRPDCRGLCPACGADRNVGPCDCPSKQEPERS